MNRIKHLAAAALAALLAYAPLAHADKDLREVWTGTVVKTGSVRYGSRVFALPPGDWLLVARESFKGVADGNIAGGGRESTAAYFAQVDGKKLVAVAAFTIGLHPSTSGGTWTLQPCAHRDPLYRNDFGADPAHPECLLVDYANEVQPNVSAWMKRAIDKWRSLDQIGLPATLLRATYSKYQSDDYVVASYWINPEYLGGFAAPSNTTWNLNDWYRDNVPKSEPHKAYVERWVRWTEAMSASYRASMLKGGVALPLPPLPRRAADAAKPAEPARK